jgi:hypothetical protein
MRSTSSDDDISEDERESRKGCVPGREEALPL